MEAQTRGEEHKDEALGMGAWVFALLSVLFAFVAVVVAGQAFSRSNDAKSAVAEASGTPVSLSEFKIDPSVIAVDTGGSLTAKNAGTVDAQPRRQGHRPQDARTSHRAAASASTSRR